VIAQGHVAARRLLPAVMGLLIAAALAAGAAEGPGPREPSAADLVKQLGSESWPEREGATSRLAGLGLKALAALEAGLRSPDSEVFWRALKLLGHLGPAASEALGRAAADERMPEERRRRISKAIEGLTGPAFLGVYLSDALTAARAGGGGVGVVEVMTGSPAARAGFKPGDVIFEIDGERVKSAAELTAAVRKRKAGVKVEVALTRGPKAMKLEVRLGARAAAELQE